MKDEAEKKRKMKEGVRSAWQLALVSSGTGVAFWGVCMILRAVLLFVNDKSPAARLVLRLGESVLTGCLILGAVFVFMALAFIVFSGVAYRGKGRERDENE